MGEVHRLLWLRSGKRPN